MKAIVEFEVHDKNLTEDELKDKLMNKMVEACEDWLQGEGILLIDIITYRNRAVKRNNKSKLHKLKIMYLFNSTEITKIGKMAKKIFLIIGILAKAIIDAIFGLTLVLIITIVGYVLTFSWEQLKATYYELKEAINE
jgi:hypothetical protein